MSNGSLLDLGWVGKKEVCLFLQLGNTYLDILHVFPLKISLLLQGRRMLIMSLISHFSFSTYIIFIFLHFCHKVISLLENTACAMTCGIWDEGLWLILDESSFPGWLKLLTDGPLPSTCFCAPRAVSVTKPQVQIPSVLRFRDPLLIWVNTIRDGLIFLYADILTVSYFSFIVTAICFQGKKLYLSR